MEIKEVLVDLKLNRRESGLSVNDLAHLLGISKARVSKLHTGNAVMSVNELCCLSLIYGKTMEDLFSTSIYRLADKLIPRLSIMPDEPKHWKAYDQRLDSLNALTSRLLTLSHSHYED